MSAASHGERPAPAIDEAAIARVVRQGRRNQLAVVAMYVVMGAAGLGLWHPSPTGQMVGPATLAAIALAPLTVAAAIWARGLRHDVLVRHADGLHRLAAGTWDKLALPPVAEAFVTVNSFMVPCFQLPALGVITLLGDPVMGPAGIVALLAPGLLAALAACVALPAKVRRELLAKE